MMGSLERHHVHDDLQDPDQRENQMQVQQAGFSKH